MYDRPTEKSRFIHRVALASLILLLAVAGGVNGDDTELFRVESGKPYVYIVFDTSSSMNTTTGGGFAAASGDDPSSTLYQAKQAVWEVFDQAFEQNGDFIHYGLATYNQDGLRVRGKHWLYRAEASPTLTIGSTTYPSAGEIWTFGQHLPTSATPDPEALPIPSVGQLGTCESPVSLQQDRDAIDRFPKLSPIDSNGDGWVDSMSTTTIWLEQQSRTYRLQVIKHSGSSENHLVGESWFKVDLVLSEALTCSNLVQRSAIGTDFYLVRPFIMHDLTDVEVPQSQREELTAGIWDYRDAEATATCGDSQKPFTGEGWESNYDGGDFVGDPEDYPVVDPYCKDGDCYNLKNPTDLYPSTVPENRCFDSGDMIPFDWDDTYREKMFRRMAPNWSPGKTEAELDFGIASYFKDVPNQDGVLELVNPERKPLVAYGASPVGKVLNDWRCFYLGANESGGKCRRQVQPFGDGFDDLAAEHDLEWGCRKPFIIVIGDGENNCGGEDPTAETANLRRNGVKVWVINFGGPLSPKLKTLAQNTGGEYLPAEDKEELVGALQVILGQIVEQTKSFASAVVPTVQAEEDDKVFISNFKPLNTASVWPGNVLSFLKPVPIHGDGTPDTSTPCGEGPSSNPASECYLWNAGDEMLDQVQNDITLQFGTLPTQRRIYYSQLSDSGDWPSNRRYFSPTDENMADTVRYDLWRGMGLITSTTPAGGLTEGEEATNEQIANAAITEMMALKYDPNGTPDDESDDLPFILGDIFHSNPLLLGAPPNSAYFALDVEGDGLTCDSGSKSYRCFYRKHVNRRKLLMVGSSDGMVHAIDTGIFRTSGAFKDRFDRGSGKEVFGFVPRSVMPKVKDLYADGQNRSWLVDGTLVAADVFIDPLNDGATFPNQDDREWRTVAVSGLREGGRGYFALDVTQPDEYDSEGRPTGIVDYVPSCSNGSADCGTLPYPAQLWEFLDGVYLDDPPHVVPFDKDNDGSEDLAAGWSTPNLGRILVCAGDDCDPSSEENDLEDRYVAVIGGGLDVTNQTGDWLYMIDIETGKSLYKQRLVDTDGVSSGGSAPAEPAAVDTNGDGYLDRIYIGTTRGFLFRADLRGPNGEIPELVDELEIADPSGSPMLIPVQQIESTLYQPRVIFKAQPDKTTAGPASHAFYYPPAVAFSARLGDYVLAIGTGDRYDLWTSDGAPGHFYMFRDDIDVGDDDTYYTEEDLVPIDSAIETEQSGDLLTDSTLATKGWYLILLSDERLISDPFVVSGVVIFNVFGPDVAIDPDALTCSRTGVSRVFAVNATNGNGLLYSAGTRTRWFDIADFVTQPYVEQALTKNAEREEGGMTADDLTEDLWKISEEIKTLFPDNCRFTNQRLDIKTLSSDTGIHIIAPIPVCVIEKNWKDW